jgi:hypothetical protein
MSGRPAIAIAAALMFAAPPASADGTVARAAGCGDRMFVSTINGYSLLSGVGGQHIAERDELVGETDKPGYAQLYDKTSGRHFAAVVEAHGLGRGEFAQRAAGLCREAARPYGFATASVVRSEGCGSRIIVSGPQGFAVLDRLAGGTVYKDDSLSGDFNKPGRARVTDKQTGAALIVYVEDYRLDRSAAERKMRALCGRERQP